jgi:hypothetical protein
MKIINNLSSGQSFLKQVLEPIAMREMLRDAQTRYHMPSWASCMVADALSAYSTQVSNHLTAQELPLLIKKKSSNK